MLKEAFRSSHVAEPHDTADNGGDIFLDSFFTFLLRKKFDWQFFILQMVNFILFRDIY